MKRIALPKPLPVHANSFTYTINAFTPGSNVTANVTLYEQKADDSQAPGTPGFIGHGLRTETMTIPDEVNIRDEKAVADFIISKLTSK